MQDGTLSLFIAVIAALAYAAFFPFSTHLKLTDRDLWERGEGPGTHARTRTVRTLLFSMYVFPLPLGAALVAVSACVVVTPSLPPSFGLKLNRLLPFETPSTTATTSEQLRSHD